MRRREPAVILSLLVMLPSLLPGAEWREAAAIPGTFRLTVSPPAIPADGGRYRLVVELTDVAGRLELPPRDITVSLFSSRPQVATVQGVVTIPVGRTYAVADLTSTTQPGTTTLTASALGFTGASRDLTTVIPAGEPTKLAVFPAPAVILPELGAVSFVHVQLQDALGTPARAPRDLDIALASSQPSVAQVEPLARIARGRSSSFVRVNATFVPGATQITASATGFQTGSATLRSQGVSPTRLVLYPAPDILPADRASSARVAVQLEDDTGEPALAPADIEVTLTSADSAVGTVTPSLVIPRGQTYAMAAFSPGGLVGRVAVTAIAPGFVSGQTTIETVSTRAPSRPTNLALYFAPGRVIPNSEVYPNTVVVQLMVNRTFVAPDGRLLWRLVPTVWTEPIIVHLASSRTSVGSVGGRVAIPAGVSMWATFFQSTFLAGTTEITASAQDLQVIRASLTSVGRVATQLSLTTAPLRVSADGRVVPGLVIQLQDAAGLPGKAPSDVLVALSSANPDVVTVDPTVTIRAGRTFALANLSTSTTPGPADLTASASGFLAGSVRTTTTEAFPSRLVVTPGPGELPADGEAHPVLTVQLQDAQGVPAKAQAPIDIALFSSNQDVGVPSARVVLMRGANYVVANFTARLVNGTTALSAAASGFSTDVRIIRTILFGLDLQLLGPTRVVVNEPARFGARVFSGELPIGDAQVIWSASLGSFTPTRTRANASGLSEATFTVAQGGASVLTVQAARPGFRTAQLRVRIAVDVILDISVRTLDHRGEELRVPVTLQQANRTPMVLVAERGGLVTLRRVLWGNYTFVIPRQVELEAGSRAIFRQWQDGLLRPNRTEFVRQTTELVAVYELQHRLTVTSPFANASGAGWYPAGTTATARISRTLQDFGNGTRVVFRGWVDETPVNATSAQVSMNRPKHLTATWGRQFLVRVASEPGGVSGEGWYDAGATATITARPDIQQPGVRWTFRGWAGASTSTTPSIRLVVDRPLTLTVRWLKQFLLMVNSTVGEVEGGDWYTEGAPATFRVKNPALGFGIQQVFAGWQGNSNSTALQATLVMDGPKTVTATWRSDITQGLVLAVVGGLAAVGGVMFRRLRRRRKVAAEAEEVEEFV